MLLNKSLTSALRACIKKFVTNVRKLSKTSGFQKFSRLRFYLALTYKNCRGSLDFEAPGLIFLLIIRRKKQILESKLQDPFFKGPRMEVKGKYAPQSISKILFFNIQESSRTFESIVFRSNKSFSQGGTSDIYGLTFLLIFSDMSHRQNDKIMEKLRQSCAKLPSN